MSGGSRSTLKLWRKPSLIWVALMLLLTLSVGSAYVPLGPGNGLINYGVAVSKAALVLFFFMHLDRGRALVRVVACAGLFWLMFLFSLSFGDYLTRDWNGSASTLAPDKKDLATHERGNYPKDRLPLAPRFGSRD
ncbi:MAG: cytochrome C oxidase subunit IV family protein [Pseudolabrys sp.]